MLPLGLFRSRNFTVSNLTTLAVYEGLGATILFMSLFLQQVAGYSPIEAGLATGPVTLLCSRFRVASVASPSVSGRTSR